MRTTIRLKMIVSFLLILAFSCAATFIGTILISNRPLSDEIKIAQSSYADNLLGLKKQTTLSTQEILDVNVNSMYTMRVLDEIDKASLDDTVKKSLEKGEKVFISRDLSSMPATLIKLGDETIKITIRRHDVFEVFRFRIALVLLSILILSCIILAFASGRMLKPILKLTAATQKVATGDFNVSVDIEKNDEIGILIKNFNKMAKELGNMEYLQKDFMRNVSHEFKTPIASIQGFAKLLQSESLSREEQIEFSGIILEETERLSKLSSNILRLSKLENQNELTSKKKFLLDEQIRSVIVLLEPKWSQKELLFDVQMEKTTCNGDEELLQQVWMNLIENAIKFSNRGGNISISITQAEHCTEIRIADNGTGMDEDTKQRVFERFYQGNTSHTVEGSGLGLSIVKRILELSNGEIQVESSLNQGTVFLVKLPA
ncbi:MAG TPA: HAMP domain-containing sensor histidine kinase [Anaerovoracaceae bacterium]|nr:HAMP domain-containing sensor histidine kinase [Anaerovoracaceae bacterium]